MTDSYLSEDVFYKYLNLIDRSPILAVDTEGTLNHPFSQTWGLSIAADGIAEYFAFNHRIGENLPAEWLPKMAQAVENHKCLVFHNAKHDLRALRNLGINYTGKFYDTQLMAHMTDENIPSKALDYLSKRFGGEPKRNSELQQSFIRAFGWDAIPVQIIRPYGLNDAYITEQLFYKLYDDFKEQGFDDELWDIEQKFCRLLAKLENAGVLIDTPFCEQELERGEKIMAEIVTFLGLNPGSPKELKKLLIDELKLPVQYHAKTKRPTLDKAAMSIYDELLQLRNDQRAHQILTYRGWAKSTSSNYKPYLELQDEDGRIRPSFKQHGTVTGRLSCEHPNLQQIPRESEKDWNGKLKLAFIPPEGYRGYEFDYSQLEFRLAAAYAKARNLIDIFNSDQDVFDELASELGMTRNDTKTLVYTIQYGGGANRVSTVFGVGRPAANAIINNFYKRMPGLARITEHAQNTAKRQGFVKYWTGRRRHFKYGEADHKVFNSMTQGGGFEIVKRQMIAVDEAGLNNEECQMNLQVHDSVRTDIMEGKENEYCPEIQRVLEDTPDFGVKFKVKYGEWGKK